MGTSEIRAVSGAFLGRNNVNPVDYRYQRRSDIGVLREVRVLVENQDHRERVDLQDLVVHLVVRELQVQVVLEEA